MGRVEKAQKRVTKALKRQGNFAIDITVTRVTKKNYDKAADSFTESDTSFTVKSFPSNFLEKKDTTKKIKAGDLQFIFSAENLEFTPEVKDVFETEDEKKYEIIEAQGVPSAETAVLWKLQMRPKIKK